MPKLNITKDKVDSLPFPATDRIDYFDEKLTGFGVRVSPTTKTYFVMARVNGKLTRVTIGKHGSPKTADGARKEAKGILGDMTKGIDHNQEKMMARARGITLKEIVEQYFETQNIKTSTSDIYTLLLDTHLSDWQQKPIKEITREMVSTRHLRISKNSGQSSANNVLKVFRLMYNYAAAKFPNTLPENPVKVLTNSRQWNKIKRRNTYLQGHELEIWWKALDVIQTPATRDFLKLLLFTGLRKDEALSLKWSQVDFKANTFSILDPKNGNDLTLPMSTAIIEIFEDRLKCKESDFVFPGSGKSGHLVETRKQINKVEHETIKIINGCANDAELAMLQKKHPDKVKPGLTFMPHDMRRTFATIAENLVSYSELKRLLNHSSEGDVTQGYLIISTEKLREPMQRITDAILKLLGNKITVEINSTENDLS
jgi:integrase